MPSLVVEPLPRQRGAPSSAPFGTMQSPSTPVINSSPSARARHHAGGAAAIISSAASGAGAAAGASSRSRSRRRSDDDREHEHEHDEHHEHDLDEDAHAELIAEHNREQPTWQLFRELGFVHVAISCAIGEATLNGFSTFMNSMLVPGGVSVFYVSWMGTFFVVSALVGSQIASTLVDKYKWYNAMMLVSVVGSVVSLVFFQQLSALPAPSEHTFLVTVAVLMVGFFVGPLQPISIEIAAECTYPAPEAASTAVQQVAGNLLRYRKCIHTESQSHKEICESNHA